jgi:hypothetical protein
MSVTYYRYRYQGTTVGPTRRILGVCVFVDFQNKIVRLGKEYFFGFPRARYRWLWIPSICGYLWMIDIHSMRRGGGAEVLNLVLLVK